MKKFSLFILSFILLSSFFFSCERITKYGMELQVTTTEDKTAMTCNGKVIKGNPKYYAEKGFLISNVQNPEYNPHTSAIIEMRTYAENFDTLIIFNTITSKVPVTKDSTYYIVSYIRSNYGLFTSSSQEISIKRN